MKFLERLFRFTKAQSTPLPKSVLPEPPEVREIVACLENLSVVQLQAVETSDGNGPYEYMRGLKTMDAVGIASACAGFYREFALRFPSFEVTVKLGVGDCVKLKHGDRRDGATDAVFYIFRIDKSTYALVTHYAPG